MLLSLVCSTLLLVLLLSPGLCFAENNAVALVYQRDKSFSVTIAQNIADQLRANNTPTELIAQESVNTSWLSQLPEQTLIVSLGSEATLELLNQQLNNPMLSLLIPRQSYEGLLKDRKSNNQWSVLFIDQPVNRQLLLIKHLFGQDTTIGTLLGPYSISEKSLLLRISQQRGLKLNIGEISNSDQLIPALKTLTQDADVVLALPDPVAFNKNTIRGVLLLTYRENIPLIGFSRSYVKAGAIAALFSELEQISDQAHNIISRHLATGKFDRTTFYPDDFSIAINRKVARTLDINLKTEDRLIRLIKKDEKAR
jgi:ABC-type uncharacterized transport system substrate-binding protein